jgi:hypothetical protein
MRVAAAVLILTILATSPVAVRITIRRARRRRLLDTVARVDLRRAVGEPTTYRKARR